MTKEEKIQKIKGDLEYFRYCLSIMPENTILARLSLIANIKYMERKLERLMRKD